MALFHGFMHHASWTNNIGKGQDYVGAIERVPQQPVRPRRNVGKRYWISRDSFDEQGNILPRT
jgi:hypothetical protein